MRRYTDGPDPGIDWEAVDFIHCTLESPYKGGGLRFRLGSKDARKNMDFVAGQRKTGDPYIPGTPVMYPEAVPAIAGDPQRNTWIMPASVTAMAMTRKGETVPDGSRHAGFVAFGFFYAPLVEDPSIVGFTQNTERGRVATFWNGFKFASDRSNKGKSHPEMSHIGPPDVPDVTVRPLSRTMQPLLYPDGSEIAIRVREYWNFNDPSQYATEELPQLPAQDDVAKLLRGLTEKEQEVLIQLVRREASRGTKQA